MATNWCITKGIVCDRVSASGYCAQSACTRVFRSYVPIQTNADHIRSMSDEELWEFLHDVYRAGTDDAEEWSFGVRQYSFIWNVDWLRQTAEARCTALDEARENANEACAKWEGMYRMALERAEKVERERDAAVDQLRGLCSACKHYTPYHNDGPCATCTHEVACFAPEKATDKWEWVGVKEE